MPQVRTVANHILSCYIWLERIDPGENGHSIDGGCTISTLLHQSFFITRVKLETPGSLSEAEQTTVKKRGLTGDKGGSYSGLESRDKSPSGLSYQAMHRYLASL